MPALVLRLLVYLAPVLGDDRVRERVLLGVVAALFRARQLAGKLERAVILFALGRRALRLKAGRAGHLDGRDVFGCGGFRHGGGG